jgi:hypothetical protein
LVDTKDEEARRLPGLAELQPEPGGKVEASEARLYIRANFDEMTAARDRRVTWQQIAEVMKRAGVVRQPGAPLDWRQVKALYHAEKYARDEAAKRAANPKPSKQRKGRARRPREPLGPLLITPEPEGAATAPKPRPAPSPRPAGTPASPYAEHDRQMAEKKRLQEEIERAKQWNPYPAPQRKDETE